MVRVLSSQIAPAIPCRVRHPIPKASATTRYLLGSTDSDNRTVTAPIVSQTTTPRPPVPQVCRGVRRHCLTLKKFSSMLREVGFIAAQREIVQVPSHPNGPPDDLYSDGGSSHRLPQRQPSLEEETWYVLVLVRFPVPHAARCRAVVNFRFQEDRKIADCSSSRSAASRDGRLRLLPILHPMTASESFLPTGCRTIPRIPCTSV